MTSPIEAGVAEGKQAPSEPRRTKDASTLQSADQDKDIAIAVVGEHRHEIDPAVEARVVRKIDRFLVPAMFIGYGLVYYDKAILGSAVLFGMTTDLSLSITNTSVTPHTTDTSRLSWATSLFYFGMLAGLYPMTFALQRFNMGRIIGIVVCLWALICMCTAAVTNWRGLYAQRFFLGFVESIIPTGFMCIISSFYTQSEQSLRQSWWFSSTGAFTIIGGALNYGFGQIDGGDLKRWQYIYLLAGSLTFLFGICCFFVPDSPMSAWFLTTDERMVATERLRYGQTGIRCTKFKWYQIKESLLDIKVWLVAIMMASAYTVNGAVSGFGPLIVSTFGYSTLDSILFQFPLGAICLIFILLTGYLSSHIPNIRIILLIICCLPVIAGCAMIWKSSWHHHAATPVVGYTIIGFFGPVVSLIITIGMANVAGQTKKCFMAATIFVAYCVGNIVGPQLIMSQTKSRHYPELWLGLIICYCITIVAAVALYAVLTRENRKRALMELDQGPIPKSPDTTQYIQARLYSSSLKYSNYTKLLVPSVTMGAETQAKTKLPIVLGAMTFGKPGVMQTRVHDIEDVSSMIELFQSHGHDEIDTARVYGQGSNMTGVKITHSADDLRLHLDESLKALGVEKVDLFYLHAPDRSVSYEETFGMCDVLFKEGKFNRLGLSNYMSWEVAQIQEICIKNNWIRPSAYQGVYNAIQRSVEPELLPCLHHYNMSFYAFNPIAGGYLTSRYHRNQESVEATSRFDDSHLQGQMYRKRYWNDTMFDALDIIREAAKKEGLTESECALRWLVHHSGLEAERADKIIIGASSEGHLKENLVDLEKGPLSKGILEALDGAWAKTKAVAGVYFH
ncbi:hypothetical protein BOTCAL_0395g00050 [Botryotinia calthae]|uniref:Major facilitator superfamily (MFS) profile domain-containing protein n=1 Tax=Botryotinia calthae TaxID=38488 RepID=A0A4Y8CQN5_9HELO|nr:hypothetical protein BOTCAL_0395g00050 [Botryotinia calthae]